MKLKQLRFLMLLMIETTFIEIFMRQYLNPPMHPTDKLVLGLWQQPSTCE
jgi:TRAP-type C4-dicarboxylate transport system permease small subunit